MGPQLMAGLIIDLFLMGLFTIVLIMFSIDEARVQRNNSESISTDEDKDAA